jgi:hypothetical protein
VVNEIDVTVNGITFDNTNEYVIAGNGSVNLETGGVDPNITVSSGRHQFTTEVNLLNATTIDVNSASSIEFVNQLSLGGNTVTKTGGGTLLINYDSNTGTGTLDIQSGVLAGGGNVGGDVVVNGGILAPGSVLNGSAALGSTTVPEPQSAFLIAVGLLTLCWSTRRAGVGRPQRLSGAGVLSRLSSVVLAMAITSSTVQAGPYVDAVLQDNPSGYWRLEEGTGTAVDSSSVGGTNNGSYAGFGGTLTGAIPTETSNIAYDSFGQNDYIRIMDTFADGAMATSEFTVEHWLNPFSAFTPTQANSVVRGFFFGPGDTCCFAQFVQQFGANIEAGVQAGGGGNVIAGIPANEWTHVVWTAKPDGNGGTDLALYFNGVEVGTHNTVNTVAADNTGDDIQIGTLALGPASDPYSSLVQGFSGGIDEVAYYPYALSETRICEHYLAGGGSCTLPPAPGGWNIDSSGSWQLANNWTQNEIPDGQDEIASFTDALSAPATVWTEAPVMVNGIVFDNSNEYVVAGNFPINLSASTTLTDPTITVQSGDHQFQTRVSLNDDLTVDINSGSTLEFVNQLSLNGNDLTKTGDGTLIINTSFDTGDGNVINTNGVLAGIGSINGDVQISGGVISPGSDSANAGQVPEPGTLTLLGLSVLVSALIWRR